MTDFLTELRELFTEKNIPSIISDFEKSSFFREHYLTQTFKKIVKNKNGEKVEIQPSRFKPKSYYLNKSGYPIQLNQELTKKLKNGEEIKVITEHKYNSYVNKYKGKRSIFLAHIKNNDLYNDPLKPLNIRLQETKELRIFTEGSSENPEQFETWSAEKMYKRWLLLRLSNIEKPNWPIMDYVFFLFINQITCILNSYIIYGIQRGINREKDYYSDYLTKLDQFTKNGGLYKNLLSVHFLFCEWYDIRIMFAITHKKKRLVKINKTSNVDIDDLFRKNNKEKVITFRTITENNRITENNNSVNFPKKRNNYHTIKIFFDKTLHLKNFCLLIFTSYFQNVKKSNNLYAFPVIPILGIPYKTHDGEIYTPRIQLIHDYTHVDISLIPYFNRLYPDDSNKRMDIKDFFEKMLFLTKLNKSIRNKNKLNNAQYFLWWYLHEQSFTYVKTLKFMMTGSSRGEKYHSFFDIKLFKSDLEILHKLLIERNIILRIKTDFYNTPNYNDLLESIELLIEICDETLNDDEKNVFFKKIERETNNNTGAIYGNNNRNNLNNTNNTNIGNKYVKKFLEKHPDFTNQELEEYASDYKIKKFYDLNTNNENHISSFRKHFIKRVKNAKIQKNISNHIQKYINNHQDLTNEEVNNLSSLLENKNKFEELKKKHKNKSNLELLNILLQNFSNKHVKPENTNTKNLSTSGKLNNTSSNQNSRNP